MSAIHQLNTVPVCTTQNIPFTTAVPFGGQNYSQALSDLSPKRDSRRKKGLIGFYTHSQLPIKKKQFTHTPDSPIRRRYRLASKSRCFNHRQRNRCFNHRHKKQPIHGPHKIHANYPIYFPGLVWLTIEWAPTAARNVVSWPSPKIVASVMTIHLTPCKVPKRRPDKKVEGAAWGEKHRVKKNATSTLATLTERFFST